MICNLCPNNCNVDRKKTVGLCGVKDKIKIAKYYLHPYEEPCLTGKNGSGTVFFCGCSLGCVFCQNYDLSRNMRGKEITTRKLADIFRELEDMGATNINLVTPTHYSHKIIEALEVYKPNIPVVYNTHGYEKPEIIKRLFDYVDIFLPDLKYFSSEISRRYTNKEKYFEIASSIISLMTQKPLIFEGDLLKSGTIVRHLVLPQNISDSKKILDYLAQYKDKIYLNVMSQYTPFGDLTNFPELNRTLTRREYETVIDYAISLGFNNMYYQDFSSQGKTYIPNWDY